MSEAHELYRRWIDGLWNGRSPAGELVADDFVGHWPDRTLHGPGELQAVVDETRGMFSTAEFTIRVGPLVEGELVAGRWTGEGTMPDGSTMSFFGNDILRVRDGRFVEYWTASSAG